MTPAELLSLVSIAEKMRIGMLCKTANELLLTFKYALLCKCNNKVCDSKSSDTDEEYQKCQYVLKAYALAAQELEGQVTHAVPSMF